MNKPFSIMGRANSFRYAFAGIWTLLKTQHNMRIHAVAAATVTGTGFCFGLSRIEWCMVVFAIANVWAMEAFNTAIESLADRVSSDYHPLIKMAKDVAAAAVLFTATGAAIVGAIVFVPHLVKLSP